MGEDLGSPRAGLARIRKGSAGEARRVKDASSASSGSRGDRGEAGRKHETGGSKGDPVRRQEASKGEGSRRPEASGARSEAGRSGGAPSEVSRPRSPRRDGESSTEPETRSRLSGSDLKRKHAEGNGDERLERPHKAPRDDQAGQEAKRAPRPPGVKPVASKPSGSGASAARKVTDAGAAGTSAGTPRKADASAAGKRDGLSSAKPDGSSSKAVTKTDAPLFKRDAGSTHTAGPSSTSRPPDASQREGARAAGAATPSKHPEGAKGEERAAKKDAAKGGERDGKKEAAKAAGDRIAKHDDRQAKGKPEAARREGSSGKADLLRREGSGSKAELLRREGSGGKADFAKRDAVGAAKVEASKREGSSHKPSGSLKREGTAPGAKADSPSKREEPTTEDRPNPFSATAAAAAAEPAIKREAAALPESDAEQADHPAGSSPSGRTAALSAAPAANGGGAAVPAAAASAAAPPPPPPPRTLQHPQQHRYLDACQRAAGEARAKAAAAGRALRAAYKRAGEGKRGRGGKAGGAALAPPPGEGLRKVFLAGVRWGVLVSPAALETRRGLVAALSEAMAGDPCHEPAAIDPEAAHVVMVSHDAHMSDFPAPLPGAPMEPDGWAEAAAAAARVYVRAAGAN